MGGNMKKLENCNYAVQLAQEMGLSIVGIGGKDILDGSKLILAILWQLMRCYTITLLKKLTGTDAPIDDANILKWVNDALTEGGKTSTIASFKDDKIKTSLPVIDLIDCIRSGKVNYEIVIQSPTTQEDLFSNAKYAISMCRKIGARVYALPDDLVEANAKMAMTVFACLMARGKAKKDTTAPAAPQ
jgi:hypothetical protein